MSLNANVQTFVMEELEPFLATQLQRYAKSYTPNIHFGLILEHSPRLMGRVRPHNSDYQISVSDGWIVRLTLTFHVIEAMWESISRRPKVFAVNTESALDSYLFYGNEDSDFNFEIAPLLKTLFVDFENSSEQSLILSDFADMFNEDPPEGAEKILQFKLPIEISANTKKSVQTAMRFLILHEIFHVARGHAQFLSASSLSIIDEDLALHELEIMGHSSRAAASQSKKAVEIDADGHALRVLLQEGFAGLVVNIEDVVFEVMRPIYIFISTFDLCRRSLRDYEGATHPVPDLRGWMAMQLAAELLSQEGISILPSMRAAHERAVVFCVRTFQQLGIPSGAFYILANSLTSLDRQFPNQLAANLMLNDEVRSIESSLREIERGRSGRTISVCWELPIFGMSEVEVRKNSEKWLLRILNNSKNTKDNQIEIEVDETSSESAVEPTAQNTLLIKDDFTTTLSDAGSAKKSDRKVLIFQYTGGEESDGMSTNEIVEPQDIYLPAGGPSVINSQTIFQQNLKWFVEANAVRKGDFLYIHNNDNQNSPYIDLNAGGTLLSTERAKKYANAMERSFALLFNLAGAKITSHRTTPILGARPTGRPD